MLHVIDSEIKKNFNDIMNMQIDLKNTILHQDILMVIVKDQEISENIFLKSMSINFILKIFLLLITLIYSLIKMQ